MPWEAGTCALCDGSGHRVSWITIRIAGVSMSIGCAAIGRRRWAERACVTSGYKCQRLQLEAITVTSSFSGYTRFRASTDDRRL